MSSNHGAPIAAIEQSSASHSTQAASPHRALHEMVARGGSFSGRERNCAFRNLGDGRFADVSASSGFDFADDARAVVTLDYDGDGDLDVITTNRTAPRLRILLNRSERLKGTEKRRGVTLDLVGKDGGSIGAIGATVQLKLPGEAPIARTIAVGSGFLGASSTRLTIGAGTSSAPAAELPETAGIAEAVVTWPGGQRDVYPGLDMTDHAAYRLRQGAPGPERVRLRATPVSAGAAVALEADAEGTGCSSKPVSAFLTVPEPLPVLPKELDGVDVPAAVTLWSAACPVCADELEAWKGSSTEVQILALSVDQVIAEAQGTPFDRISLDGAVAAFGEPKTMRVDFGQATEELLTCLQTALNRPFARHEDMALPTTVLLDREGQLAAIHRGPVAPEVVAAELLFLRSPDAGRPESRRLRSSPLNGRWLTPPPAGSTIAVARAWMESGRVTEACHLLERADASGRFEVGDRPASRASAEAARLAFVAGDLKLAIAAAELTSRLRPEWAKGHFNRAAILDAADQHDAAEAAYTRALALRPKHWQALANRGLLRGRTGRRDEGRGDLEAALSAMPKNAPASQRQAVFEMLNSLDG